MPFGASLSADPALCAALELYPDAHTEWEFLDLGRGLRIGQRPNPNSQSLNTLRPNPEIPTPLTRN